MSTTPYSREAMSKRFADLGKQIAKIESTSPRIERDAKNAMLNDGQKKGFKALIKRHEGGLAELKTEYAFLAKSLGGKTMSGQ